MKSPFLFLKDHPWDYFNPISKSYESVFTNEIVINVLDGPKSFNQDNSSLKSANNTLNNISSSKGQFKFLKTKPNLILLDSKNFIYSTKTKEYLVPW